MQLAIGRLQKFVIMKEYAVGGILDCSTRIESKIAILSQFFTQMIGNYDALEKQ